MDGIEPELVDKARAALVTTPGVINVPRLQLRWVGHRLQGTATLVVADTSLSEVEAITHEADHQLAHALPNLDDMVLRTVTVDTDAAPHSHDH